MAATSDSNKVILWARLVMLSCIAIMVAVTVGLIAHAGIKAPLLTMIGSVTVISTLYPPRVFTMQNTGTLLGTGIVMGGGGYWLRDAVERSSDTILNITELLIISSLAYSLILLLAVYVFISMLITADWNYIKEAIRKTLRR